MFGGNGCLTNFFFINLVQCVHMKAEIPILTKNNLGKRLINLAIFWTGTYIAQWTASYYICGRTVEINLISFYNNFLSLQSNYEKRGEKQCEEIFVRQTHFVIARKLNPLHKKHHIYKLLIDQKSWRGTTDGKG